MDQPEPKISVQYAENAVIATLTSPRILDEVEISSMTDSLIPLIEETEAINLVLDFTNVEFCSSAVLGLLIRLSKKIYQTNGSFKLCAIAPKILEIFKITRLDRIFEIYQTQQQALDSIV